MSQQINVVTLGGNLTRDPELRSLPSGTSVCTLRIANNRRRKVNGEWKDVAGYFDVITWGAQADACARYLSKGRPIMVRGELRWREWEAKEGGKRQAIEINADEVQFLGGGDESRSNSGSGYQEQYREPTTPDPADYATAPAGEPGPGYSSADDSIPF